MPVVQSGNAAIHYEVTDLRLPWHRGGRTIVFHHGLGASADIWLGWLPAVQERYRIVRFDMRGHGRTPAPDDTVWAMETYLADLSCVIDAVADNDESVHLVGESIGATIALAFALAWPEKVATLTMSNGAHKGGSIEGLHDWEDVIRNEGMAGWSRMMMEKRFYPGAIGRGVREWFETQQSTADPRAILGGMRALVGADLTPDPGRAGMPVLVVHPDASPFIPVPLVAELPTLLPSARLQVVPHARHGMPVSHARVVSRSLAEMLAESG